jgi:hypothetical protein
MPGLDDDRLEVLAEPMTFERLVNHIFVETPNSSLRHSDLFDLCESPRPDPGGISETPAEAKAGVAPDRRPRHRRTRRTRSW